jgi:hypothetical protein
MNLKRRFFSMIAVLFALTFVAGACSDDDDASTDTDTEDTVEGDTDASMDLDTDASTEVSEG